MLIPQYIFYYCFFNSLNYILSASQQRNFNIVVNATKFQERLFSTVNFVRGSDEFQFKNVISNYTTCFMKAATSLEGLCTKKLFLLTFVSLNRTFPLFFIFLEYLITHV